MTPRICALPFLDILPEIVARVVLDRSHNVAHRLLANPAYQKRASAKEMKP